MDNFKEQVRRGFQACKDDINQLSSQQSQLNSGQIALEEQNKLLREELRELRSSFYKLQDMLEKTFDNKEKNLNSYITSSQENNFNNVNNSNLYKNSLSLNKLPENNSISVNDNYYSSQREKTDLYENKNLSNNKNQQQNIPVNPHEALKQFKVKANKKEILKNKMFEMIGERGMFLNELKFMFVDCYKYTSKATFYNYLKEVELEKSVRVERINNKNMVYLEVHKREELIKNQNNY